LASLQSISMFVYGPDSADSSEIAYQPLGLTGWITTGGEGNGRGTVQVSSIGAGELNDAGAGVGMPEPGAYCDMMR